LRLGRQLHLVVVGANVVAAALLLRALDLGDLLVVLRRGACPRL
jgi:hypothetical protein